MESQNRWQHCRSWPFQTRARSQHCHHFDARWYLKGSWNAILSRRSSQPANHPTFSTTHPGHSMIQDATKCGWWIGWWMEVGNASRNALTSNKVFWNRIVLYQRNVRSSIVAWNNADGSMWLEWRPYCVPLHKTQTKIFKYKSHPCRMQYFYLKVDHLWRFSVHGVTCLHVETMVSSYKWLIKTRKFYPLLIKWETYLDVQSQFSRSDKTNVRNPDVR
jgi:hypothetical protein